MNDIILTLDINDDILLLVALSRHYKIINFKLLLTLTSDYGILIKSLSSDNDAIAVSV